MGSSSDPKHTDEKERLEKHLVLLLWFYADGLNFTQRRLGQKRVSSPCWKMGSCLLCVQAAAYSY